MADRALDDASRPAVRDGLVTESIDDELVIFDPVTAKVHQLDPLGALVWQLLDGTATVGELIAELADGFGVPKRRVRADLDALFEKLVYEELLVATDPTPHVVEEPARPEYLKDPPAP